VHIPRLSDLPPDLASAVGEAVSKVAKALTEGALAPYFHTRNMLTVILKAMGNTGLNVVCNQEYAQAVPHVSVVHCRSKFKVV
jgi:diadenosine tetraphosphate (Ap4A) HIT family hydrolase